MKWLSPGEENEDRSDRESNGGKRDGGRRDGGRSDGGRRDGGRSDGGRSDGGRRKGSLCSYCCPSSLPGYVSHVSGEGAPEDSDATPLLPYQVASQCPYMAVV